jgi:hypothetical protein
MSYDYLKSRLMILSLHNFSELHSQQGVAEIHEVGEDDSCTEDRNSFPSEDGDKGSL